MSELGAELSETRKEPFTPTQELKMRLFSEGVRISERAHDAMSPNGGRLGTRDYVSTKGIIAKADGITINIPTVDENPFAKDTRNLFDYDKDERKYVIRTGNGQETEVEYIPPPAYLDKENASGERYGNMIATHTDRARISPLKGCALNCQFCDIPSLFKNGYKQTDIKSLLESIQVAIDDEVRPAQHLLISGGSPGFNKKEFEYLQDIYREVSGAFRGLDIDVMMTPSRLPDGTELLDPEWLKSIGIKGLSVNMEMYDYSDLAKQFMPGKANIGKDQYLSFLKRAVEIMGVGNVRSILMVGLESVDNTLKAVEELTSIGVCPELSPFRPDPSTPLKNMLPPSVEDQKRVYLGTQKIIASHIAEFPGLNDGLQCIDCMHNVLMFPGKNSYRPHYDKETHKTTYEFPFLND